MTNFRNMVAISATAACVAISQNADAQSDQLENLLDRGDGADGIELLLPGIVDADVLLGEGTVGTGLGLAIMNRLHKASGFRTIHA